MIGLIMKTLNSIPIVSVKNIVDLKHYLATNYPDLDADTLQQYMADFISKTLDSCLSYFSEEYRLPLRQLVLNNTRKINIFEVYASDVLKAGLQLGSECPAFQREVANWVGEFQVDALAKETVVNYILNHCRSNAKPAEQPLKPENKGMTGRMQSMFNSVSPVDPHAQTVVLKVDAAQRRTGKKEPQFDEKWVYPYGAPETSDTPGGTESTFFSAWFKKIEKLFNKKLRNLAKNRNLCIAAVIFLFLLFGFPRVINSKARMSPNTSVAHSAALETRKSSSDVDNGVDRPVQPHAADYQKIAAQDGIRRPTMPLIDAPNTIVVGYVKEKTASGLVEVPIRRYFERKMRINASAYDLSVASCGKDAYHPEYGITRTGTRAKRGRTIAVDPRVIPLGSKVYIVFPKKYRHMNGIYVAEDTGRKIKGYRIDIFWGEDAEGDNRISREARSFGRRKVEIYLLQD